MPITTRLGSMSSRGFGQFITRAPSARIEYITAYSAAGILASLTIPSLSIGSSSTSRVVVFSVVTRSASSQSLILSLDGTGLTRVYSFTGFSSVFVFQQKINSGSAVSLTLRGTAPSATLSICAIGVHSMYDLRSETNYFSSSTVGTSTISITIPARDKSVHVSVGNNGETTTSPSMVITGLTQNYLMKSTNNGGWAAAGGSGSSPTATSLVVSQTNTPAGINFRLTVLSWE